MQLRFNIYWPVLLVSAFVQAQAASAPAPAAFDHEIRPLIEEFCYKCHGLEKAKGGINLATVTNLAGVQHDPKTWQTVESQLRERNMPPDGKPQPKAEDRTRLIEWVRHALDTIEEGQIAKDPGRVLIHRLSRLEYNNTVRDLLGVTNRPADRFPADGGGGGGFDNNADTLFIPPILMEKYLEAAAQVLEAAPADRLFTAKPGGLTTRRQAARKILARFAPRAFRRPAQAGEVDRLMKVYDAVIAQGEEHEAAVRTALKAVLVSPAFLFRIEVDQDRADPYRVSDYELASRLSYFIWSSMPDEELMRVAGTGKLREPATLDAQVKRMLQDPKARGFAENFVEQWLGIRSLKTTTQPDPRRYPTYTPELRDALYDEPVEFFHALLRDNGGLMQLLDADHTYLNAALAKHYGIEGVEGAALRRVSLPDRNRGGLLGMGAVLTVTSYPQRTSPVLRGKWVLEEILGSPPPPPPPNAGGLPADDAPKNGLSFRQRLEQHRSKAECASCHNRMDPIGFGLENFDGIGRWRSEVSGQKVDATGVMPTGEQFSNPAELKTVLLARKNEFLRNLTEKMLAYALGRGLEVYDVPTINRIAKQLRNENAGAADLVREVVGSFPFQYRRNQPITMAAQ